MKYNFRIISSLLAVLICLFTNAQVLRKRTTMLMGSKFDISIVDKDARSADENIDKVVNEITRIENLISEWKPDSQISEVNKNAGIKPVKVDREVFDLTKKALEFSKMSNGAFDISIIAMDKIWKFDGTMTQKPTEDAIKKSIQNVGYQNIILDSINSTIFLKLPNMKIGFGATGKGYAADKGKELMLKNGIENGIVNASGDMTVWGNQPLDKPWKIGITNPFKPDKVLKIITLHNEAVVTSGSYEKFVLLDGQRYSHIINPTTGYPAQGLISVTIIGPNAEKANAFSTSIMVLGKDKGLDLIKKYPEYQYLLITDKGKIIKSKNFNKN